MKYLVVCDGGNVRSHALAFELKWVHKQEAIAAGRIHLSPETMNMLSEWAERIILMQPHMIESIPEEYHNKVTVVDVGPDRWGIYIHPELHAITVEAAKTLMGIKSPIPAKITTWTIK
jgi:hypothetical protein